MKLWRAARDAISGDLSLDSFTELLNDAPDAVDCPDGRGCTPAMLACFTGCSQVLALLVSVLFRAHCSLPPPLVYLLSSCCSVLLHCLTYDLQAKADLAASSLERDTCLSLVISKCDQLGHARSFTPTVIISGSPPRQCTYAAASPCQRDT